MATLVERIRPTVLFCRLFGMGFQREDSEMAFLEYWILLAFNLTLISYTVFTDIFQDLHIMKNLMDVMSFMTVIRYFTRTFVPVVAICSILFTRNIIIKTVQTLDDLIPSVKRTPLSFYSWYFYGWLTLSLATDYLQFFTFWISANFGIYSVRTLFHLTFYNIWISVPVAQYVVLIMMIQNGIRGMNDDITSISKWKSYRTRWKMLKDLAEYLTNYVFAAFIIVYVLFSMCETFFFAFVSFLAFRESEKYRTSAWLITALMRARFVVHLFQICQNCKKEIMNIQNILNGVKTKGKSDVKVQYASLYMLHTDFKLMPYAIFELSTRNLLPMFTVVIVFLLFQIQMKLFGNKNNNLTIKMLDKKM
ncbi:uncharacterized protein LOC126835843 [Adelges cooleyi]|uniref:uncharacterized protein LOC126835843 n=1 Tax=Adelges cooleyi TaxID=133065 RepID=UPI00217FDF52|nr:uncharacterized protein LOC126835843 [Adelges cooleyi]